MCQPTIPEFKSYNANWAGTFVHRWDDATGYERKAISNNWSSSWLIHQSCRLPLGAIHWNLQVFPSSEMPCACHWKNGEAIAPYGYSDRRWHWRDWSRLLVDLFPVVTPLRLVQMLSLTSLQPKLLLLEQTTCLLRHVKLTVYRRHLTATTVCWLL